MKLLWHKLIIFRLFSVIVFYFLPMNVNVNIGCTGQTFMDIHPHRNTPCTNTVPPENIHPEGLFLFLLYCNIRFMFIRMGYLFSFRLVSHSTDINITKVFRCSQANYKHPTYKYSHPCLS